MHGRTAAIQIPISRLTGVTSNREGSISRAAKAPAAIVTQIKTLSFENGIQLLTTASMEMISSLSLIHIYVVKYIVERHGGTITARNAGGLLLRLCFPKGSRLE